MVWFWQYFPCHSCYFPSASNDASLVGRNIGINFVFSVIQTQLVVVEASFPLTLDGSPQFIFIVAQEEFVGWWPGLWGFVLPESGHRLCALDVSIKSKTLRFIGIYATKDKPTIGISFRRVKLFLVRYRQAVLARDSNSSFIRIQMSVGNHRVTI